MAIVTSLLVYDRSKSVLSDIDKKAAVIEESVSGTQAKLVDTVTEIAKPQKDTVEDKLLESLLPMMVQDPALLTKLMELGKKEEE